MAATTRLTMGGGEAQPADRRSPARTEEGHDERRREGTISKNNRWVGMRNLRGFVNSYQP